MPLLVAVNCYGIYAKTLRQSGLRQTSCLTACRDLEG
ncbi:hypothetical protein M2324_003857 [Rhodovulum sulfidophilum]|nr:hypothetical protein [Rhodovulum sulfidophilum]